MFKTGILNGRFSRIMLVCFSLLCATFFMNVKMLSSAGDYFQDLVLQSLPGNDPRVLELLKQQYLTPPSTLPYNFSNDPEYQKYSRGESWKHIHHYLRLFFSDQRGGFFVEAGALDGEFLSNSLWLEKTLRWKGLLIEPDSKSYIQLLDKHRHSWSSNTCISTSTFPKETVHVSLKLKDTYTGVKWYYRGSSHEYGVTLGPSHEDFFLPSEESMYKAHCFPLESYLKVLNITSVDVLSLDIQGIEEKVLKTIPWDEISIKFIIVEVSERDFSIPDYLKNLGYSWVNYQENFWREDLIFASKELLDRKLQSIKKTRHPQKE